MGTAICVSRFSRFTSKVVSLAQKAVGDGQQPPVQEGEGGYVDRVIVALHGIQEYFGEPYCRLTNVLGEMVGNVAKCDLTVGELPDFITVCTRKQDFKMLIWRVLL